MISDYRNKNESHPLMVLNPSLKPLYYQLKNILESGTLSNELKGNQELIRKTADLVIREVMNYFFGGLSRGDKGEEEI